METMKRKKATFELWEVLVIALISSLMMSITTGYLVYRNNKLNDCSKVSNNPYIGEFITSYNSILNEYYTDVDEKGLISSAINGMMTYLDDPYSSYLNENNTEYLVDSLKGTYEGIGIKIDDPEEGLIIIDKVYEGTPAAKAGLLAGDVIKMINETDINGRTATDVVNLIKNSNSKKTVIKIERNGETLSFEMEKTTLYTPVVVEDVFEKNGQKVGYLGVSRFSETVGVQFKDKLAVLENKGINSLIIDLRGNTGGYLKGAADIASMFLKQGSVMYSLKTKLSTTKEKVTTDEKRDYKIYLLIDGKTASASEVLAASLKDNYQSAKLIGEKSYGKGKVQQTSNLTGGSMIKYTTAEWLTPKGVCIEGIGLTPDVVVVLSEEYGKNPTDENDNQLQSAIFEITK